MNKLHFGILISMVVLSCGLFESNDNLGDTDGSDKVYVALQGLEKIGIVNIASEVVEEIDINYISGMDAPHFISIDYTHRYWFVTTMMSGLVGRYNLNTGDLIDTIFVGDSPALMAIDENTNTLYVSRMMLMNDEGEDGSRTIQPIDYSDPEKMELEPPLDAIIPGPHAIAINSDGSKLFTSTFFGDWLYKFMLEENNFRYTVPLETGYSQDINDPYPTKRMKPVQAVLVEDSLLILSCSAGEWQDIYSGITHEIPGQVHLWNVNSEPMERKDTFLFSWDSRPWHLIASPTSNRVFVVLKGEDYDIYPDSDGVACLSYTSEGMINDEPEWIFCTL